MTSPKPGPVDWRDAFYIVWQALVEAGFIMTGRDGLILAERDGLSIEIEFREGQRTEAERTLWQGSSG